MHRGKLASFLHLPLNLVVETQPGAKSVLTVLLAFVSPQMHIRKLSIIFMYKLLYQVVQTCLHRQAQP
jgi:hypothetical protein